MNSTAVRTSAVVGVLLLVLRYWTAKAKETRLITDFAEVGRRVKHEGEYNEDEYDVIIVGGGTAGCVLASRLSEDPTIRVLLLEAGQSGRDKIFAQIPSAYSRFWLSDHDYKLYTEPQVNAAGLKKYWPRAKLLGGCTNMNAMMFHYGAPSDYDEWAEIQKGQPGALGWTYKEFHPYFRKFEKYSPSREFPDVDVTLRGAEGLVNIGYHGYFSEITRKFVEACDAAGIARSHDVNTHKGTLGVTKVLTYINAKGRRVTMETAYLTPDVLARPNLKVATGAFVNRILFDGNQDAPRAVGVEFNDKHGGTFRVKALKEVIVAAGTVHTPQILMLSGVGPASHLSALGIHVVADLPGVGSNLKDHVVVDIGYMDKTKQSLSFLRPTSFTHSLQLIKALWQYKLTGKGPLTTNLAEAVAFIRTDDPDIFPPSEFPPETAVEDTTTGKAAPDIELFVTPVAYNEHGAGTPLGKGQYTFMLHTVLLRPNASGTIRLQSKNPADSPLIDPQYLSDQNDVKNLIRGVRLLDRVAHTNPLKDIIDPAGDNHPKLHQNLSKTSDKDLENLVRERVQTLYHPTSTARMAPLEDGGVVDPFLRVHGIPNLRIADASIFPSIVSGHTTAPVIAIGEKAADLIKNAVGGQARR